MNFYVGVTDHDWFRFLRERQPDEVNFGFPSSKVGFAALQPGEPFLFKLHSPYNAIAGGGFFVRYSALPLFLAWVAFGQKNGAPDYATCHKHIKPYSEQGPHALQNGLLLRADLHLLFDRGLLTITDDYRVEVSQRIKETYNNGKEYYRFHGERLIEEVLPEHPAERPSAEYLSWHQNSVFR